MRRTYLITPQWYWRPRERGYGSLWTCGKISRPRDGEVSTIGGHGLGLNGNKSLPAISSNPIRVFLENGGKTAVKLLIIKVSLFIFPVMGRVVSPINWVCLVNGITVVFIRSRT